MLGLTTKPTTPSATHERRYSPEDRIRFTVRPEVEATLYGDVYYTAVNPAAAGDCLSSLLPDGNHAPVLDVDGPVTCTALPGGTDVTFHGTWRRRKHLAATLEALIAAGLASTHTAVEVERLNAVRGLRRLRPEATVTVRFPYEVVSLPSKTNGHFHLLCQTVMTWAVTVNLGHLLGAAGLADFRHSESSARGGFYYVRQPVV